MDLDKDTQKKKTEVEFGGLQPSKSLLAFLDQVIKNTDDFHKNLDTDYDKSTFKKFERRFIDLRKDIKEKIKDITNPDQEYLNHSKLRKDFTEEAIQNATKVAESFQEARENARLNFSKATDVIEDFSFSLKNLKNLIERQSKK